MKNFRQRFLEMKEGFLEAKLETAQQACEFANKVVISTIYLAICFTSMIFIAFDLSVVTYAIIAIAMVMLVIFNINSKLFNKVMPLGVELLVHFFGKYGRVITKQDWKRIKKQNYKLYRNAQCNKSLGKCYFYSRAIALHLKDAKLMYCSIKDMDGNNTAHAAIVKNGCVYCPNARMHMDLEEYKEYAEVNVYKIFSEEEYRRDTFFDDIRQDFMNWCAERNVYCDPQ